MLDLNKSENNHAYSFLIQDNIREIAYFINNILIINIIGYSKKFSLILDFKKYINLLKKYLYLFFGKKNHI